MPVVRFDLDELDDELGDEVADLLVEISNSIVNSLKEESPVGATGDLRRSWQIFVTEDNVVYLGSRIHYAMYIWKGTPPHTPPFEPIETWARRVIGDESAAGGVWQKIRQEGTDPNPFVDEAIEQGVGRVTDRL